MKLATHPLGILLISLALTSLFACSSQKNSTRGIPEEDRSLMLSIESLSKQADQRKAVLEIVGMYRRRVDYYKQQIALSNNTMSSLDRDVYLLSLLETPVKLYRLISENPLLRNEIPDIWDPTNEMNQARNKAAQEYYRIGSRYLGVGDKGNARMALDAFRKVQSLYPGFLDTKEKIRQSELLSTTHVLVNPVNYLMGGFGHWGLQNDYLQQRIVRDLNFSSFSDAKFYTHDDYRLVNTPIDKIVDLTFLSFNLGGANTRTETFRRTAQIQVGTTNSIPSKPVYETVEATVTVYTSTMRNSAILECRIYDRSSNRSMLQDRFPGNFIWTNRYARYVGDRRALTQEDLKLINTPVENQPNRNELSTRLINECYNTLINRIRTGVRFL